MLRSFPQAAAALFLSAGVLAAAPLHAAPAAAAPAAPAAATAATATADAARIDAGARRFAQSCAFCHGSAGAGGSAPALRGRADLAQADIEATIANGRQRGGAVMPAWKGALSSAQIGELAAYLVSLKDTAAPR